MKILLAFPTRDMHTGYYIKMSLLRMGHTVEVIEPSFQFMELYDKAKKFEPEMILCSRTGVLFHDINDIRAEMGDISVYCWNTDARGTINGYAKEFGEELIRLFRICDTVYTVARGEVEMFNSDGINAKWLVQGIFPDVDNPGYDVSCERYIYDVSFLGSIDFMHDNRIELMRHISRQFKLNVEPAHGSMASDTYLRTKVNIGHAHSPHIGENSVRDLKIMGSGGFLLTRWYDGIDDVYKGDGKIFDTYKSIEECLTKIRYWLDHDAEREEVAVKAMKAMHARHKYSDRLEIIIDDCKRVGK